jgi:hypothetical protein
LSAWIWVAASCFERVALEREEPWYIRRMCEARTESAMIELRRRVDFGAERARREERGA